jgi:hypothetical protein
MRVSGRPLSVTVEVSSTTRAMPKSTTRACRRPSSRVSMRMLSGLRSRWTMPIAWAAARGVGDLRAEVGDGARAELAVGVEVLGEADAADQLDHEVGAAVGELAGVDRAGDVGVIDAGGGDGLALEAGAGLGVARELGADDLDRDLLAQLEVLGDVDGAHATFTEQLDDAVAAVDDLADAAESGERTVAGRVRVGDTEVFCDRGVPRDLAARWHGGAVYPREPGARLSERSDLAGALARAARAPGGSRERPGGGPGAPRSGSERAGDRQEGV